MTRDLHHHLTHDHGRAVREIAGVPLGSVHHLEHFDQSIGLLHLDHQHANDVLPGIPRRNAPDL